MSTRLRRLPSYHSCYVCGGRNPHGLAIPFQIDEQGCVRFEYTPRVELAGYPGVVHGGVLTAVLDEGMGWASTFRTGRMQLTLELQIKFRKPVPPQSPFEFFGEERDPGQGRRRILEGAGRILSPSGELLVEATGKYMAFSREESLHIWERMQFEECDFDLSYFQGLLESE